MGGGITLKTLFLKTSKISKLDIKKNMKNTIRGARQLKTTKKTK
jgi:hypothetical protein